MGTKFHLLTVGSFPFISDLTIAFFICLVLLLLIQPKANPQLSRTPLRAVRFQQTFFVRVCEDSPGAPWCSPIWEEPQAWTCDSLVFSSWFSCSLCPASSSSSSINNPSPSSPYSSFFSFFHIIQPLSEEVWWQVNINDLACLKLPVLSPHTWWIAWLGPISPL